MWCRHCQQETPALGPASSHGPRCGRCHRTSTPAAQPATSSGPLEDSEAARRQVYRSLRSAQATIAAGPATRTLRYDAAETPLGEAMSGRPVRPIRPLRKSTTTRPPTPASTRGQSAAWLFASSGAAGVGLGLGLGGWSLFGERPEFWNFAVAAMLGGQALMIVGLVQLLASLWNAARGASAKLAAVHDELRYVRRTTDEHAGRHTGSAALFYANLANDASNETLMGNLRAQLDRLAARVG